MRRQRYLDWAYARAVRAVVAAQWAGMCVLIDQRRVVGLPDPNPGDFDPPSGLFLSAEQIVDLATRDGEHWHHEVGAMHYARSTFL